MIEREFIIVAIHGEGDRDTVNSLQKHRNTEEVVRLTRSGALPTDNLLVAPDEPPEVIVVLRDLYHGNRIEWTVDTWDEVEMWKKVAGWDVTKRHWGSGTTVKVKIGG